MFFDINTFYNRLIFNEVLTILIYCTSKLLWVYQEKSSQNSGSPCIGDKERN